MATGSGTMFETDSGDVCAWEREAAVGRVRCQVVPSANPAVYLSCSFEFEKQQKSEIADLFAAELPGIKLLSGQILKLQRQLELAQRSPGFGQSERFALDAHAAFIHEELISVGDRLKMLIFGLLNDQQKKNIEDVEVAFTLGQLYRSNGLGQPSLLAERGIDS